MMGCPVDLPQLNLLAISPAVVCVWSEGWALLLACFFAGLVDSIGGGGGLISVPALLTARVPPAFVLGTNKSISSMGSMVAVFRYAQAGLLPRFGAARWALLIGLSILAGAWGAAVSQLGWVLSHLQALIPLLLISVMIFLAKKWFWDEKRKPVPAARDTESAMQAASSPRATGVIGLIAFYDGLFGPGTGTFFLSFLEKMGFPTIEANAITKVFNLSANIGALASFAARSRVIWPIGIACASAIMLGNFVGSSLVLKRGKSLVRITVMLVTTGMLVKLVSQLHF